MTLFESNEYELTLKFKGEVVFLRDSGFVQPMLPVNRKKRQLKQALAVKTINPSTEVKIGAIIEKILAISIIGTLVITVLLSACSIVKKNENSMNKELQKELIRLAKDDNTILEKLSKSGDLANYKDEIHPELKIVFERNTKRAKQIIKEHGWPKISLVGEEDSDAMYYIVQHSVLDEAFMQSCVPLLSEQVKNKEAKGSQLAFLQDRTLMQQNKPQVYGTQHIEDGNGKIVPYLVDKQESVDEKRSSVGLEPLKERTDFLQKNHENILKANEKSKK